MYWYKLKSLVILIFGLVMLTELQACKPEIKNNDSFDLTGYFKREGALLKKLNKPVVKTVTHNKVSETKTVHISDWEQEFGFFIESDINKPALKNSYTVATGDGLTLYKAKEKTSTVQELIIKRDGQKIKYILIFTNSEPKIYGLALYKTNQRLTYYPDSLYRIETIQHVKLLGTNYDTIEGIIK
jgi:hypothetical protein